jgi:hypothetical protein
MKSPMILNAGYISDEDKKLYSDLRVLKSGAGFYIGTTYYNKEGGFIEPGSRDSQYFKTEVEAKAFLKSIESLDDAEAAFWLRKNP